MKKDVRLGIMSLKTILSLLVCFDFNSAREALMLMKLHSAFGLRRVEVEEERRL
jgi:hypothetical protein